MEKRTRTAAFAPVPVLSALAALSVALILSAGSYGYHRDELYFRMLPPAWGYVDQPPLAPFLARMSGALVADSVWAERIPAIVFAVASVLVIALITREVGGGPLAQGLAAWGYAFGSITLVMGHVFLTASMDLFVWPALILAVMRALLRERPWWWLIAGTIAGLSLYNKFLIAMLLAALAVGLLAAGPRAVVWSKWVLGAIALALAIGLPNVLYQGATGWPQLAMGAALSAHNGADVRTTMWPFLLLMLGPPLVPFWVAGVAALARRRNWRPIRFLVVAFPALLVFVWAAGAQYYYPYGMLATLYAIGCVPVAEFARRTRWRRVVVIAAIVSNSVVCVVISLPAVPVGVLGSTPIPGINASSADQVGWPDYAGQVSRAVQGAGQLPGLVILASNYGEAGALERFGEGQLPAVYSGHNALYALGPPPAAATAAIVVGAMLERVRPYFARCTIVDRLDNGVHVDNEEQDQPIAVCTGRLASWSIIWPALRHLD
ncbi:MAG: glycosyltransferase family 39 protein [Actinomycetales bacterium]